MQAVILCGGLATRLYPVTKRVPKSLIVIEGKPFLDHQISLLKKNKINDLVLCVGHLGKMIKNHFNDGRDFGVNIKYSEEGNKLLGTGGAIKKAENKLKKEFLVMYGDSYLPFNFQKPIEFFKKDNKLGLMVVYQNNNRYEPSNVIVRGNLVKKYNKIARTKEMKYIDYGVSILKKAVLSLIPNNKFYDLTELHQSLIIKKQLLAYESTRRFYEIGSPQGLAEFKKFAHTHKL